MGDYAPVQFSDASRERGEVSLTRNNLRLRSPSHSDCSDPIISCMRPQTSRRRSALVFSAAPAMLEGPSLQSNGRLRTGAVLRRESHAALPENGALAGLASGLAAAHKAYGNDKAVVMMTRNARRTKSAKQWATTHRCSSPTRVESEANEAEMRNLPGSSSALPCRAAREWRPRRTRIRTSSSTQSLRHPQC
jgi:hypothetical protein